MTADPSLEGLGERVAALERTVGNDAPARPAAAAPPARPAPRPPQPAAASEPAAGPVPAAPAPEPAVAAAAVTGTPTLQQVKGAWQSIRTRVEGDRASASLQAQLKRAVVSAVDAKTVTVTLADPMQADILRGKAGYVERAIADVLGVPLTLRVVVEQQTRMRSAHRSEPGARADAAQPDDPDLALLDYASERIDRRAALSSDQR